MYINGDAMFMNLAFDLYLYFLAVITRPSSEPVLHDKKKNSFQFRWRKYNMSPRKYSGIKTRARALLIVSKDLIITHHLECALRRLHFARTVWNSNIYLSLPLLTEFYRCWISHRLMQKCNGSHDMRKPVYAICEQQRRRSACASAQSDQRLCFRCLDSIISVVSIYEISTLYLASVAAHVGLSLTWSKTPKTGFLLTRFMEWWCDSE